MGVREPPLRSRAKGQARRRPGTLVLCVVWKEGGERALTSLPFGAPPGWSLRGVGEVESSAMTLVEGASSRGVSSTATISVLGAMLDALTDLALGLLRNWANWAKIENRKNYFQEKLILFGYSHQSKDMYCAATLRKTSSSDAVETPQSVTSPSSFADVMFPKIFEYLTR